jgi:O-acetyl-ADP-ribose deacetylase (regulator of RNase III)
MELTVVRGDITQQEVDAVVNAANRALRGGGGVDGAIHRAGGPAVLEDCIRRFPHGLATGDAGWTTSGNMPASWVIHVVGPNYAAGERDRSLLTSCYSRALAVADELGARSIAFPLISAGIYGWPKDDAIAAAVETLRDTPTEVEHARLVAFDQATYDAIAAVLGGYPIGLVRRSSACRLDTNGSDTPRQGAVRAQSSSRRQAVRCRLCPNGNDTPGCIAVCAQSPRRRPVASEAGHHEVDAADERLDVGRIDRGIHRHPQLVATELAVRLGVHDPVRS